MAQTNPTPANGGENLPFWQRSHYLDRMSFGQLVGAYFQHYTIIAYLTLAAASAGLAV